MLDERGKSFKTNDLEPGTLEYQIQRTKEIVGKNLVAFVLSMNSEVKDLGDGGQNDTPTCITTETGQINGVVVLNCGKPPS